MPEHCSLLILSYCTATNTIVKLRPLPVADASSSCFYRLAAAAAAGEEGGGRKGTPPTLHYSQCFCSLLILSYCTATTTIVAIRNNVYLRLGLQVNFFINMF